MSFHVGQMVVLIYDGWIEHPSWRWMPNRPLLRMVYTVRDIVPVPGWERFGGVGLRLQEIVNPVPPQGWSEIGREEGAFPGSYFRPVKETSIEVFRQLLVTPPHEVVS